MNKRHVFLSFLVLLTLFVCFSSAARAAEHVPPEGAYTGYDDFYARYDYTALKIHQFPGERYYGLDNFDSSVRNVCILPVQLYYMPWASSCRVCNTHSNTGLFTYGNFVDEDLDCYVYWCKCDSCLTYIECRPYVYTGNSWTLDVSGRIGSPFLGKITQVTNGVVSIGSRFINFVVSNWLVFILVSLPLIGVGLAFVIRLIKKNK